MAKIKETGANLSARGQMLMSLKDRTLPKHPKNRPSILSTCSNDGFDDDMDTEDNQHPLELVSFSFRHFHASNTPIQTSGNWVDLMKSLQHVLVKDKTGRNVFVPTDVVEEERWRWASNVSMTQYGEASDDGTTILLVPKYVLQMQTEIQLRGAEQVRLVTRVASTAFHFSLQDLSSNSAGKMDVSTTSSGTSKILVDHPDASSTPNSAKKTVSFRQTVASSTQNLVWPVHHSIDDLKVSGSNHCQADDLPEGSVTIADKMVSRNKADLEAPNPVVRKNLTTEREKFSNGSPDYSCPHEIWYSPRESRCNFLPLLPAGIREGDRLLPEKWRGTGRYGEFALGEVVDPKALRLTVEVGGNIFQCDNTSDRFIVTGPFPCFKSVKMGYLDDVRAR